MIRTAPLETFEQHWREDVADILGSSSSLLRIGRRTADILGLFGRVSVNSPFAGEDWNDAITLSGGWSGAPGRFGIVSLAVIVNDGKTSIWQWDDEIYTTPELVASYEGSYAVRSASKLISEIDEGGICACPIEDISVTGETGWQADLLAIAWWRDGEWDCTASPLTSILLTMSDEELAKLADELRSLRRTSLIDEQFRLTAQVWCKTVTSVKVRPPIHPPHPQNRHKSL